MIICIPTNMDNGMESQSYSHFGSAQYFILYDTEKKTTETIDNINRAHDHGNCHPMKALKGKKVEAVVVGGIGKRAISGLNEMGIKVYQSTDETISALVERLQKKELKELTFENACAEHHGCN